VDRYIRLRELAGQHRRIGYLRLLHTPLRREVLVNNRQKTYRLYKAERLAVRPRRRRRLPERERLRLVVPQPRNQRWSMDFASDIVKNPAPLSRCIRITRKPLTPSVGSVEGRDAEPLVWRLLSLDPSAPGSPPRSALPPFLARYTTTRDGTLSFPFLRKPGDLYRGEKLWFFNGFKWRAREDSNP
jgi:hypothetical protein